MAFTWEIDTRGKLVTIVGSGPADYGVSVEAMRAIAVDPRYRPEFDVLVDVRKLDYVASLQEVRQFVDWMVKLVVFKGRMAIVVSDSLQFGAGRQFSAVAEMRGREIEIFMEMESARRWLGQAREQA